jgi:hypothetical protein
MIDVIRDLLAGFGAITLIALTYDCVRGWIEAGPPSSHDIRRRPWTEDERDQRRKWDRIQGR